MKDIIQTPIFWIFVSLVIYLLSVQLYKKFKFSSLNPLLISGCILLILLELKILNIEVYKKSSVLQRQLIPFLTLVFILPMYRCRHIILKRIIPILVGGFVGMLVSIFTVWLPLKFLTIPHIMGRSLLTKSITTPLALEIINFLKGSPVLASMSILITGIIGSSIAPLLFRIFRITDPVAKGFSLGSAAHLVGAARAEEYGEIEAGAAGAAIGIFAAMTILFLLFVFK